MGNQHFSQLRTISHLLHSWLLDEVEVGLSSALRSYAQGFMEGSKIKVNFEVLRQPAKIIRRVETAVSEWSRNA